MLCLPRPKRFRQPEAWASSPRARRAFSLCGEWPGQPEAYAHSSRCGAPFPSAVSGPGSQRLGRTLAGCGMPFPSAAPVRAAGRVSGSLQIGNGGLFARWEGGAFLGLSLPLSPPPCLLPPAGVGRLFSGVCQSLCLFGFCLPSLRCLISALTQAGGGDLLFRFASSVQSHYGEGGGCRQTSLCVGSTPRVPATVGLPRTGVSVLSPSTLLRLPAALYGAGPALSTVPAFRYSTKARIQLCLRFVPPPA